MKAQYPEPPVFKAGDGGATEEGDGEKIRLNCRAIANRVSAHGDQWSEGPRMRSSTIAGTDTLGDGPSIGLPAGSSIKGSKM